MRPTRYLSVALTLLCVGATQAAEETEDEKSLRTLNKAEIAKLKALDEPERLYVEARLKGLYLVGNVRSSDAGVGYGPDGVKVNQIIDSQSFLGYGNDEWYEGVSTSNLVDDTVVDLSKIIFVSDGSKSYGTVLGAKRTVRHYTAVDDDTANELLAEIAEARGYRLFKSVDDKTMIAKFLRKTGKSISLRLPNGRSVKLLLDHFSEADQEWLTVGRKAD